VPLALTTSASKAERLRECGAHHVLVSDADIDPRTQVREVTHGRGADVVLDAVGGPGLPRLARAARTDGRVVVYGWLDPRPAVVPMNWPLTIIGYNNYHDVQVPEVRARMAGFIDEGVRRGALVPVVDRVFPLESVVDAHRYLDSGEQFGKIVLSTT
jgi:NADPH:quinone reductase-like Zn-dependent oxidoreductase